MMAYRSDRTNAHELKTFNANLGKERKMRKLIIVTVVFVLAGLSASYAQGCMGPGRMA